MTVINDEGNSATQSLDVTVNDLPDGLISSSTEGIYSVGGSVGETIELQIDWIIRNAGYNNEIGMFVVDDETGVVNGVAPGDRNYARTALSSPSTVVLFASGEGAGASTTLTLDSGSHVMFYMIQNNTTDNWLRVDTLPVRNTGDSIGSVRYIRRIYIKQRQLNASVPRHNTFALFRSVLFSPPFPRRC